MEKFLWKQSPIPEDIQRELDLIRGRLLLEDYNGPASLHPEYRRVYSQWKNSLPSEKKKARNRRTEYYSKNREKIIATQKAYADSHVEELKEYRQKNKERRHETSTKWRKANWERHKQTRKAWAEKNRHVIRMHIALRRAREISATIGDPKEIAAWEKEWRSNPTNICEWCRMETPTEFCDVDHAEPLSLGGPHNLDNLVISCRSCNNRKRNKPLEKWLEILGREPTSHQNSTPVP